MAGALASFLARRWWQPRPDALARLLLPLAWVYGWLERRARTRVQRQKLPVPVIVVGNLVVGGAGKTPAVIALVQALAARGLRPGVVSRGYGRRGDAAAVVAVRGSTEPDEGGDEPVLIARRGRVPVFVGGDRVAAARALLATHPHVDVIVADDGLQHAALPRDAVLIVFDERGAGNGLLLPAGPLRSPFERPDGAEVLYTNGRASTAWPGWAASGRLEAAWPLAAWHAGDDSAAQPLSGLRGQRLLAAAGLAAPEKFFALLQAHGLEAEHLPLPDHFDFARTPWPEGTPTVLVTEKDAVKLDPAAQGGTAVWVLPLDFRLPDELVDRLALRAGLPARRTAPSAPP